MPEDEEIRKLRQDWPNMSYEEKVDKFLWKMVWFHHTKHTPGSPSQPIWDLAKVIENATKSSDSLTTSIKIATWVAGLATAVGVVVAIIALFVK